MGLHGDRVVLISPSPNIPRPQAPLSPFICAPANISTAVPHPSVHLSCLLSTWESRLLLSSVPSSFHERHMLPSASVRSGTQRDGIPPFKMLLSGKRTLFSLLSHASWARPSRPDAPERRHIPGSGLTRPHVWL